MVKFDMHWFLKTDTLYTHGLLPSAVILQ